MIHLHSVSKTVFSKHHAPKPVFRSTSIALPTDRRVAIIGDRGQGKTALLRLLAGLDAPDSGAVSAPLRLSPIANSRAVLNPRLSGIENIRLFARISGIDCHQLTLAIDAMSGLGAAIEKPTALLGGEQRQLLELALLSALPFDCYLLDDATRMPNKLLECCFSAAERRGAGMIFTTGLPRHVYQYADYAVVVRDYTARAFTHLEEAIESYERKSA
jgi:capsular polysaccharide transport system ATP-binding protein